MSNPPPPPTGSGSESSEPPNYGSSAHSNEPERGFARTDTGEHLALAGAGHRFLARAVDLVVVGLPTLFLGATIFGNASVGARLALTAIWLIYEVSMVALKGRTLGKMATRIMVVRAENGGLPEWEHSFRRWAPIGLCMIFNAWVQPPELPIFGVLVVLIYLSFVWDKKRQGWHDRVGKTLVVKT